LILSFALGFVANLFLGLLIALLFALCVSAPLAIALIAAVVITKWMGLAAIYLAVGRSLGRTFFSRELSYFASILTGFLLFALIGAIPFLGWFVSCILSVTGLGLMLLSRFGAPASRSA
jgi:hypothetical protein